MKIMLLRVKHFSGIHGISRPRFFINTFLRNKTYNNNNNNTFISPLFAAAAESYKKKTFY